ncbi:MAG: hypothetical protein U0794_10560 [Isosphaeraceae bacterium]
MGFFDALRRVLGGHAEGETRPADPALARAWGLDEVGEHGSGDEPSAYDRAQWIKRLKRIFDELPGSQGEWVDLMSDARALHLDDAWVRERQIEEFRLQVRRAVSDRNFTEAEHRNLDLARDLIGLPEAEAEAMLHAIVAEAESFFGRSVEGK